MTRPLVLLFPGQSSRDPEMFARARAVDAEAADRALADFERLAGHPFDGNFATNVDVQLAVHLVTRVYRRRVADAGLVPVASAGMSLGEYAHLVQIGALSEDAADTLIAARARHYDCGPDGCMVAVTPGNVDEVEQLLADVRQRLGIGAAELSISNHNSARQVVIAGQRNAVHVAAEAVERELFALTTVIEDRIPMHVERFAPVAAAFRLDLERTPWRVPRAPWWSNVTGNVVVDPSAEQLVELMTKHVTHRVRWAAQIHALVEAHPGALLLEVGPGRVLTALAARDHLATRPMALDAPRGDFESRLREVLDACR